MVTVSPVDPLPTDAAEVAVAFLEALAAEDLDTALALVDDDLLYQNVSLPSVRGKQALDDAFRPLLGRFGFQVVNHHVAVDTNDTGVVLTERTDALVIGPVHVQFWVYGRFEVRDGLITLWRDSFDWGDMMVGLLRGLVGAVLPGAARRMPSS